MVDKPTYNWGAPSCGDHMNGEFDGVRLSSSMSDVQMRGNSWVCLKMLGIFPIK